MAFRSPQTEHHDGNAFRVISIFPELRPDLDKVYEQAAEGTEYFFTRYRPRDCNLRSTRPYDLDEEDDSVD
jgi:hypothetical protein